MRSTEQLRRYRSCASDLRIIEQGRIESEFEKLRSHGIGNILALRGDIPAGFDRESAHYRHASELMKEIADFGGFCIGGACYPEGHPESANSADDIEGIQRKVDAGCEFLTTQMFFDNNILYNFLYRLYPRGDRRSGGGGSYAGNERRADKATVFDLVIGASAEVHTDRGPLRRRQRSDEAGGDRVCDGADHRSVRNGDQCRSCVLMKSRMLRRRSRQISRRS